MSFAANEASRTVIVDIRGDTAVEADETFRVTLADSSNGVITTASADGTIRNDDAIIEIIGTDRNDHLTGTAADERIDGSRWRSRTGMGEADPAQGLMAEIDGEKKRQVKGAHHGNLKAANRRKRPTNEV